MPDPVPAHAAFNRKKRKLIIDSQRETTPTLPSLPFLDGSSSEDISIVTDLSNEAAYTKPNHTDVGILPFVYVYLQKHIYFATP